MRSFVRSVDDLLSLAEQVRVNLHPSCSDEHIAGKLSDADVRRLWARYTAAAADPRTRGSKLRAELHAAFLPPASRATKKTDRLVLERAGARIRASWLWRSALHAPEKRPKLIVTARWEHPHPGHTLTVCTE